MTDFVSSLGRPIYRSPVRLATTKRFTTIEAETSVSARKDVVASLLSKRSQAPVQTSWQREVGFVPQSAYSEGVYTFTFRNGTTLRIPETFEAIGTRVWDCAPCMSRWFEKGDFVRGKNILEIGACTGLLGLACASLGAKRVILTDLQSIYKAMEKSIIATGLGDVCIAEALDWNDLAAVDSLKRKYGPFDMIVASDVLVFAGDASMTGKGGLIEAVIHLAEPGKTEILMGCNKNRHGFLVGFYANPPHDLFDIEVVNKEEVDLEYYTEMIMLYRMYLKEIHTASDL